MQTAIRAILYDAFMVFEFFYYYIGSKKVDKQRSANQAICLYKMIIINIVDEKVDKQRPIDQAIYPYKMIIIKPNS